MPRSNQAAPATEKGDLGISHTWHELQVLPQAQGVPLTWAGVEKGKRHPAQGQLLKDGWHRAKPLLLMLI